MTTLTPFGPWTPTTEAYVGPLASVRRYGSDDTVVESLLGQVSTSENGGLIHRLYTGGSPFMVTRNTSLSSITSAVGQACRPGASPNEPQWVDMDVPPAALGWVLEAQGAVSPPWLQFAWCEANGVEDVYEEWNAALGRDKYWAWQDTHWTGASGLYYEYSNTSQYSYPAAPWTGTIGPLGAGDVHTETFYAIGDSGSPSTHAEPILALDTGYVVLSGVTFSSPLPIGAKVTCPLAGSPTISVSGWGPVLAVGLTIEGGYDDDDGTGYYRGVCLGYGTVTPNSFRWVSATVTPYLSGQFDNQLTRLA